MRFSRQAAVAVALVSPQLALAADLDGSGLSAWWGVPFAGILLSIALVPLLAPMFLFPDLQTAAALGNSRLFHTRSVPVTR